MVRKKPGGCLSVFPAGLYAFFVVDVHVEICAVLLGELNPLVVEQGGMFYGSHAGADRILDSFRGVGVRRYPKAELSCLIYGRLQFFIGKFLRVRTTAVRQDRAAGQDFD